MTSSSPKTDPRLLALVSAIAETPAAHISGQVLTTFHRLAGEQLLTDGLLSVVGEEAVATSMVDHDDKPVTLSMSPNGRSFGYFSPNAGWVVPATGERAVYGLQFCLLFEKLLVGLDCLHASRPTELIPNILWEVGAARVPGRAARVPVWIARRLADPGTWQTVLEQVRRRPAPGLRLILSLTPDDRIPETFVRGHEIVAIQSVIDFDHGLRIAPDILAARLANGPLDDSPVTMTADGGSITVRGKTYTFTGTKQRAIIRHLYEAWRDGDPQCLTAEVFEAAGSGDQVRSLGKAFKGRTDWREFIKEEGGQCCISL